jgi:hypothetical protein
VTARELFAEYPRVQSLVVRWLIAQSSSVSSWRSIQRSMSSSPLYLVPSASAFASAGGMSAAKDVSSKKARRAPHSAAFGLGDDVGVLTPPRDVHQTDLAFFVSLTQHSGSPDDDARSDPLRRASCLHARQSVSTGSGSYDN